MEHIFYIYLKANTVNDKMATTKKSGQMKALGIVCLSMLLRGHAGGAGTTQQQESPNTAVTVTETIASRYVKSTGSPIGVGPVQQFQADFNLSNYLTVTGWQDYDLARKAMDEVDIDLTAHKELCAINDPCLKGGITGSASVQSWRYPSKWISNHNDQALISTITYSGPVTVKFTEKHLLTDGLTWNRNNYVFDLSKSFDMASPNGSRLSIAPNLRTAYDDNFFGYRGWNILTPGGSLKLSKGNISIEVFEKKEFRMNVPPTKKGFAYGGISVTINDLSRAIKGAGRK